jgi:hypothetical protein
MRITEGLTIALIVSIALLLIATAAMAVIAFTKKNPFGVVLASIVGGLLGFVANLSIPELSGNVAVLIDFSPTATMQGNIYQISTTVPFATQALIVGSLTFLAFVCLLALMARRS